MSDAPPASTSEIADLMSVVLARQVRDGESVFFGVASPLPMVAVMLARALHAPSARLLTIAGGVDPHPASLPASTVDPLLAGGARALLTLTDIFDLSARGRLDLAFLGGAQIDGAGRLNMTSIGPFASPKVRLPGGAGSAALLPTARRAVIWRTKHDPRTFIEQLDFITAAGNVDRVVTPLCVFQRAEGRLRVESRHPWVAPEMLRAMTGFAVDVDHHTPLTPPLTDAEHSALVVVDPQSVRLTEFSAA